MMVGSFTGGSSQRAAVLFVNGAFLHHECHVLEDPDVRERIASDRDNVG
jgi:hypothetical protein